MKDPPKRLEVPESLRVLLRRSDKPPCTQCRISESDVTMLRCTRCEVAHYCSQNCQRKHFKFHKEMCRQVSRLTHKLDASSQSFEEGRNEVRLQLMELLIVMGYRETDTAYNGRIYYKRALRCLLEYENLNLPSTNKQTEKDEWEGLLLLLTVFADGDESIVRELYLSRKKSPIEEYENMTLHSFSFQMVTLLLNLKTLAKGQSSNIARLKEETIALIDCLIADGRGDVLLHLRDTIPFDIKHAPDLASPQIPEIWSLYQDSFFTTRGVNDLLHDFIPEDLELALD